MQKPEISQLLQSSKRGNVDFVRRLLLEENADPNIGDSDGETPLHSASWNGHAKVVELLLEAKANPSITNKNGTTPLSSASWRGHAEVVDLLLKAIPDTADKDGETPLHFASTSGYDKVVKLLLEAGAKHTIFNYKGHTPLSLASRKGYVVAAKLLLEAGADPNIADLRGKTLLYWASKNRQPEVVKLLLEAKADPNIADWKGLTPLSRATGNIGIMGILLAAGADTETYSEEDLNNVINEGLDNILSLLLLYKMDVSKRTYDGIPIIWLAASKVDSIIPEIFRLLLLGGANPDKKAFGGDVSALTEAVRVASGIPPEEEQRYKRALESINLMVQHGAIVQRNLNRKFWESEDGKEIIASSKKIGRAHV